MKDSRKNNKKNKKIIKLRNNSRIKNTNKIQENH